jgi:hypothetical protein
LLLQFAKKTSKEEANTAVILIKACLEYVSRAKDQLWIVHSLDYNADLKSGDMRRRLLEYAANPQASAIKNEAIDRAADSPFEAEVAKSLVAQG